MKFEVGKKYIIVKEYFQRNAPNLPYYGCDVDIGSVFTCSSISERGYVKSSDVSLEGVKLESGLYIAHQSDMDNGSIVQLSPVDESSSTTKVSIEEYNKLMKILIDTPEPTGCLIDAMKSFKSILVEENIDD